MGITCFISYNLSKDKGKSGISWGGKLVSLASLVGWIIDNYTAEQNKNVALTSFQEITIITFRD